MLRRLIVVFCLMATAGVAQNAPSFEGLRNSVGRLDMGKTGFCTGSLVAPDIVLTAAHCLFDKGNGARFSLKELTFQPGMAQGKSQASRGVRAAFIHPKYRADLKGDLKNLPHDLALLQLDRPLPGALVADVSVAYPNLGGAAASVLSYGKGRSDTAEFQQGCHLAPHSRGVILTTCHANAGTSGAPVFQIRNGRAAIVSIVSASARADGAPVSLVVPVAEAFQTMQQGLTSATPARFEAR